MDALWDADPPPEEDPLEAALTASCQALFALQMLRSSRPDDPLGAEAGIAMGSLREVIAQLRTLRQRSQGPLTYGFIQATGIQAQPAPNEADQSSP